MKSLICVCLIFALIPSALCQTDSTRIDTVKAICYNSGLGMAVNEGPNVFSNVVDSLHSRDSIFVVEYNKQDYAKVRTLSGKEGYFFTSFLTNDEKAVLFLNEQAKKNKLKGVLFYKALPKKDPEKVTSSSQSSQPSSSYRTIHTGPRGGQYYINSNGKKTYVKKK